MGSIEATVVATGLAYGESPRWHQGRLWLSNWGIGEILAFDGDGASEVMARVDSLTLPYSIDWLPDGRLLVVSGPSRQLLVQDTEGTFETYADLSGVFTAGACNEIVVDARGNAYVNGGGFDVMAGEAFEDGAIALVSPDGAARTVADGIAFGNGMALTDDGRTLLVAESYAARITAFDIAADGGLSGRREWAAIAGSAPDGICIDSDGAVWFADVPNRRCVRANEAGEILDVVEADRGCFACMLGGPDGSTLFITAAEWRGMDHMFDDDRTGVLLAAPAPAPRSGRP